MKRQIFFRKNFIFKEEITLLPEEIEHLKSLRLFTKEKEIEIRDGKGTNGFYLVKQIAKNGNLREKYTVPNSTPENKIASAIPKGNRLDWALQKGTEIGVTEFIFINFHRSERKDFNLERCEKIIAEASSGCGRHFLPSITLINSLTKLIDAYANLTVLTPGKENKPTTELINTIPVIGPEGGFDPAELDFIKEKKINTASLGKNILRIETALIYMATLKNYLSA